MLTTSTLWVLVSNAVTLRRETTLLLNRIALFSLMFCLIEETDEISLIQKITGLHGGLLRMTNITQIYHIFLVIICILILQLTSLFPRIVLWKKHFSLKDHFLGNYFVNYTTKFIKQIIIKIQEGEHLKIIEYSLILLFVVSGAILLMSTHDLVTIFLSIELQSYGLYIISTINRNSELASTGGLIYFLLGGLAIWDIAFFCLKLSNSGNTL